VDYIPINSINDIEPEKISIRDLNRKYVDRKGNHYGLRFDLQKRKVVIVRLATSKEDALRVRDEILNKKRGKFEPSEEPSVYADEMYSETEEHIPVESIPIDEVPMDYTNDFVHSDFSFDAAEPYAGVTLVDFNEERYVKEVIEDLRKVRYRQSAVINYAKKSPLYDSDHKLALDDLERNMDLECWQKADSVITYYRELYSYPRPITYYFPRLSAERRKIISGMANEADQLSMIRRWELMEEFQKIYAKILEHSEKMKEILQNSIEEGLVRDMPSLNQKEIGDALIGCDVLIEGCMNKQAQLEIWKKKYP